MKRAVRFSGVFLSIFLLSTLLLGVNAQAVSEIDTSTASAGYFTVKTAPDPACMKVGVTTGGQTAYYDYTPGETSAYVFAQGDGVYTVTLFRNISGTQYRKVTSTQVNVQLESQLAPYLVSTEEITFSGTDAVGQKAAELCRDMESNDAKVTAIHNYMAANFTYDHDFAASILSGAVRTYTPDTSAVLKNQKGICYDFAALFAAMCRSQNVPCAIVRGYLNGESHAWNVVWMDGIWQPVDLTRSISWQTNAAVFSDCVISPEAYGYTGSAF